MAPLVELRAFFLPIQPVRIVIGRWAIFGFELVQWEESRGVRLFALPGQGRELFVREGR